MRPRKPVCVKCNKTFKCESINGRLIEMFQGGIYKIWHCDIYKCPKCGMEICYGFGDNPVLTDIHGQDACSDYVKDAKKKGCWIVYDYE